MAINTTRFSRRFKKIFSFTRFFSAMCGADVVRDDYQMNWITWVILVVLNGAVAFTIYTMYVGIAVYNDWTEILKCLCMFCTGIQGYAKLINALKRPHIFRFLYLEITSIYRVHEQKTQIYQELLTESISLVKKLLAILIIIVVLAVMAIVGIPVFYEFIMGKRVFIMPFFFPYIDYNSNFGYFLTSSFHVICIIFGSFGNFVSDSWCFVFAAHIPLMKNILKTQFNELDDMLEQVTKMNEDKVQELLVNIFKWHQKYIIFCQTVKDLFFWVIFAQVSMEFVSMVCTVVCIFLGVWPAAPVFLVYSFVLFYFYCALGNLVEISNDDVVFMIYNSNWYNLNVSQQKMVLLMLKESQQAEGISIGGIAPLSMNTALQLTKTIYTFSMMFQNFLNT